MKKLVVLLLVCILFVSCAAADDLSGLSFDDLIKLRDEINAEIISRPEWKEVPVPVGEYIIGIDIPAGSYSIRALDNYVKFQYYATENDTRDIETFFIDANDTLGNINLKDGMRIVIHEKCIFSPPQGLGF